MSQSFEEGCDNIWPRSEYILSCILHHLDNLYNSIQIWKYFDSRFIHKHSFNNPQYVKY